MDSPNFDCPVCLDIINEPVSLPCGHNFCSDCLQEMTSYCKGKCPVCRRDFLSKTYKVNNLIKYFIQYEHCPSMLKYPGPSEMKKDLRKKKLARVAGCMLIIAAILLLFKYKARNIRKWPIVTYQICTKLLCWIFAPALGGFSELWRYVLTHFVSISLISNL